MASCSAGRGVLVLEEYEHAKARRPHLRRAAGFGMSGDAYHMTAPGHRRSAPQHGQCAAERRHESRRGAVSQCPWHLDAAGDKNETEAIKPPSVSMSGQAAGGEFHRSMTGHLLGGAGG